MSAGIDVTGIYLENTLVWDVKQRILSEINDYIWTYNLPSSRELNNYKTCQSSWPYRYTSYRREEKNHSIENIRIIQETSYSYALHVTCDEQY